MDLFAIMLWEEQKLPKAGAPKLTDNLKKEFSFIKRKRKNIGNNKDFKI